MENISYYSKDAINSRQNWAHSVHRYERNTEYGVTKIYYFVDLSTTSTIVSGVTIIPGLFYIGDHFLNDGDGCTLKNTVYFDAHSGDQLSYASAEENKSKNRRAEELNNEGNQKLREGDFEAAFEKFTAAYQTCTNGYIEEANFKNNVNTAKNKWADDLNRKGTECFNRRDYAGALSRFEQAYKKCTSGYSNEQIFLSNQTKAKREIDAIDLNSRGDDLFNAGRFNEARSKYQEACENTQDSQQLQLFTNNKNKAQSEINAINWNSQGDVLFNEGNFTEAKTKYQNALNASRVSQQLQKYTTNRNRAQAEIDAINFNSQGDVLFNEGNFAGAKSKYQNALNASRVSQQLQNYTTNRNKAQAEIDAIDLNSQGDVLFNEGNFAEARSKYQNALDASRVNRQLQKYTTNRNRAQAEIDAINLNTQGDVLFNEGNFDEARGKYQNALNASRVNQQLQKYTTNKNKAQAEIDAIHFNSQGDVLFNQGNFAEAKSKYQNALTVSKVSQQVQKYTTNRNKAQAELDAINLNSQGDILFNKGKFTEARSKYQNALSISKVSHQIQKYTDNLNKVQPEIDAMAFSSQGDKLFHKGNFDEAKIEYENALDCSQIGSQHQKYFNKILETRIELDAINFSSQGAELFDEGRFIETKIKYQNALRISKVKQQLRKYTSNMNKAQAEIDAINLNTQGNVLFTDGKFAEAKSKYQKALNVSKVNQQLQEYTANKNGAQAEIDAIKFNSQGKILFNEGKFDEAKSKYQNALTLSKVSRQIQIYTDNMNEVQPEIDAIAFNSHGDVLFNQGNFDEAKIEYKNACDSSQITEQRQKYLNKIVETQIELDAINFNSQGDDLFDEGRFIEAKIKYQNALRISKVNQQLQKYTSNTNKAQAEINAANLNSQGNILFKECKFVDAKSKYQEALSISKVGQQFQEYNDNLKKTQTELDSSDLNSEGETCFSQRRFRDALKMFEEAYNQSHTELRNQYKNNIQKAQTELDAIAFYNQGNILFNKGFLKESLKQYQEAYSKSQLCAQRDLFISKGNVVQAKIYEMEAQQLMNEASLEINTKLKIDKYEQTLEKLKQAAALHSKSNAYGNQITVIEVIKLNLCGDEFFAQRRYSEAIEKYQAACDKAQNPKKKSACAMKRDKTKTLIDIETLWNEAWNVESDDKKDRSREAMELFHEAHSTARSGSLMFPDTPRIQHYEALIALKIEGNTLFNRGMEIQHNGVELFREAKLLLQQQLYQKANTKFNEAKIVFLDAKHKFLVGSEEDQRFALCLEIVEDEIIEVEQSIRITNDVMNNGFKKLNVEIVASDHEVPEELEDVEQYHQVL